MYAPPLLPLHLYGSRPLVCVMLSDFFVCSMKGRIVRDRAGLTIRGGCGGGRGSGLGAGRFDSCTLLLGDHRARESCTG